LEIPGNEEGEVVKFGDDIDTVGDEAEYKGRFAEEEDSRVG
jgi:hypothetical protein